MTKKVDYEKFDELVKEENEKPVGDLYCPECGSSRLYYFIGGSAGWIHVCKRCGYHGLFIVEDGEIAEEISNRWENNRETKPESD